MVGVKVSDSRDKLKLNSQKLEFDATVLAVGHSARDVYQMLMSHNIPVVPKEFAVSSFLGPSCFVDNLASCMHAFFEPKKCGC